MNELKAFYITDGNDIKDLIIGTEEDRQVALTTLDFIESRSNSWLKHRLVELPAEGIIYKGYMNIVTTIKMNGIPIRAIVNNFDNLVEIIDSYSLLENEYRKYTYITDYMKL